MFFRSENLNDALSMICAMFGFKGIFIKNIYLDNLKRQIAVLSVLLIVVLKAPNTQEIMKMFRPKSYLAVIIVIIAIASLLRINRVSEFLYFQF